MFVDLGSMKKYLFIVLLSLSFAQRLDSVDVAMEELRTVVETASRNGQRVLVDDFTASSGPPSVLNGT